MIEVKNLQKTYRSHGQTVGLLGRFRDGTQETVGGGVDEIANGAGRVAKHPGGVASCAAAFVLAAMP